MRLIYILYDSIGNSIFAGQIWALLLKKITIQPSLQITLISFERQIIRHDYKHQNIKIIQIKRYRYLGRLTLFLDLLKLKTRFKYLFLNSSKIIARGPFAGWIALKLLDHSKQTELIIQARGLCAEEYQYSHQTNHAWLKILTKLLTKLRYLQLFKLEKKVYRIPPNQNIKIECVSPALQDYFITSYYTHPLTLTIAQEDFPSPISTNQLTSWRTILRKTLNIASHIPVYCYSGSNHKWQCPNETIQFFAQTLTDEPAAFLLILTPQAVFFHELAKFYKLPPSNYLVLSVAHHEIYQYLAIADYGLLLREKHILNWVSRPTKALEYQNAGLKIIHNQTVEWLIRNH